MHKDKIAGFISCKDGSGQELKEFGTFTCELKQVKAWLQGHHIESSGNRHDTSVKKGNSYLKTSIVKRLLKRKNQLFGY